MALATHLAAGEVILNGDIHASPDALAPELTPTGVAPGTYTLPTIVVDAKGRILWAQEDDFEIPCADVGQCGIVIPGNNLTFNPANSEISIPLATTSSKGVVEIGSGFIIDGCCLKLDYAPATTTTLGAVKVPTAGNIDVDSSGNISLPLATESSVGVMQVGTGLDVSAGVVSVDISELPAATESSVGFMQVGNGLDVSAGVVSVDVTEISFPDATTSGKGMVQVGDNISVTSGVISIPTASTIEKGIVKGDESSVFVDGSSVASVTTIAAAGTLGLIKVGSGLGIDGSGVLVRGQGDATYSSKGIVQVTENTGLTLSTGVLSGTDAAVGVKGVVSVGSNVDVASGVISVPAATNSTLGVAKSAASTRISISAGAIDVGSNVGLVDVQQTWTAAQTSAMVTLSDSGPTPKVHALDLSQGNVFFLEMNKNNEFDPPTNAVAGGVYTLVLKQNDSAGHTVTFDPVFKFQSTPTITATSHAKDVIQFVCVSSTEFVCVHTQDYK